MLAEIQKMINKNIMELAEAASNLMESCGLCPRNCRCNRNAGESGYCGIGKTAKLCKELVHYTEEPELVPTFSVYFAGCNMRCGYCSNAAMLVPDNTGEPVDHKALAARIDKAAASGAKTIFFLGGEPGCSLYDVLLTLANVASPAPVVWNSNMYISAPAFKLILQMADVFLADIKFGNNTCALDLADTPAYLENVHRNIVAASNMGKRVIIRHLPLAGHFDCCTLPVLEWVAANCPDAPVGIIPLIPPDDLSLKPPPPEQNALLDNTMARLGLRKINYTLNNELPKIEAKTRTVESVMLIRPDGSIVVQDTSAEIFHLLNKLSLK
jgi:putative pyruvate formate lyase activating enzyme